MVAVWNWLKKKEAAPLGGAPPNPRQKTYSAASGYVYQYYFEGQRRVSGGAEYVYAVTADRRTQVPVTVFLRDAVVNAWIAEEGRDLNATERSAIARLALKNAFDERAHPDEMRNRVLPELAEITIICETLDFP